MRFVTTMLTLGTLTLSTAALATTPVAQTQPHLVWSNARGLVDYNACAIIPVVAHPSASIEKQLGDQLSDLTSRAIEVNRYLNFQGATPLTQTFWQASRDENGALLNVTCETEKGPRSYVVFSVYDPQAIEPIAAVGVRADELSILQTGAQSAPVTMAKVSALTTLDLPAGVTIQEGSPESLVCIDSGVLNVRSEDLNSVLFTANRHEPLKVFQSFDGVKPKKTISGTTYTFVKVQFPNRSSGKDIGWVPEQYAVAKSACPGANVGAVPTAPAPTLTWRFPTIKRPTDSYKSGMRMFNARRGGGTRTHAACDLYRVKDEQAVAVTAGTVIRNTYYFYEGTYAIEVKHTGGKIARYGEITGKAAPNVALNSTVKTGQIVGYIGKVNSNCCAPMLHFELYSGTKSGSLTTSGNKYNRRSDLMNPTTLLTEWEKATFGASY